MGLLCWVEEYWQDLAVDFAARHLRGGLLLIYTPEGDHLVGSLAE